MAFTSKKIITGLVLGVGASMLYAAPAAAQASRTWVSGVGDDANPCSRTAPCKTFAGAISKTAAGGEMNCLDPGGWGAVTITKSMTIDCSQFPGSILNAGTNGINVVVASTDKVVIRGLEINASSLVSPGISGVRFSGAGTLLLENMVIRGNTASGGLGVNFIPNGVAKLYMSNVTVSNNGNGSTGGGIEVAPAAGGSAQVVLTNVRSIDNANFGFRATTANTTVASAIKVTVDGSFFSGNTAGFAAVTPPSTSSVTAMLVNSTVSNNTNQGIFASGSAAVVRVGNTTITGNGTALAYGGGAAVNTYGDNRLNGNTSETTLFSTPVVPKQ
jgi:hypothetical protein